MGKRPQPRLLIEALTREWRNGEAREGQGSEPPERGGLGAPGKRCVMKGPPLGPGGEDITWPDQVAPRGGTVPSTRNVKPQTSSLTCPMPSKQISPCANISNTLFNYPHALKKHSIGRQHLKPPVPMPSTQILPSANISNSLFHCSIHSNHISTGANTSNPLFDCPNALKTLFTQCQHLQTPFPLPPYHQNTCSPETTFSTPPMP